MNNKRRKEIAKVLEELSAIRSRIETLQSDEQDAFDNMPEGLQQSNRGQACEQAASRLDDALSSCDEIDSALNEAME